MVSDIFVPKKLNKLYIKIINLKNFDGWLHSRAHKCYSPRGGWNIGIGGLAPVSQAVGSSFRLLHLLMEKD